MEKKYYVIVDLDNLSYMKNGNCVNIEDADKFKFLTDAKKELKDYDADFTGAIYEVIEIVERRIIKKV